MKYSIIIPAYNVEKYIDECVSSIINQKGDFDVEIILINDGSKDNTDELCLKLAKNNSNIKYISKVNEGVSATRNLGIESAEGDYVFFLDSDDFWNDNVLVEIDRLIKKSNPDLIVFEMNSYFNSGETVGFLEFPIEICNKPLSNVNGLKSVLRNDYSFGWCPVCYAINRAVLINNRLKFPVGYICEDVLFTLRLWSISKTVIITDLKVYNYRRDNLNSTTHTASFKFSNDLLHMCKENIKLINNSQIFDDELKSLLYLNIQTLICVVLYHYSSYSKSERKTLAGTMKTLKPVFKIKKEYKHFIRKKEKIVCNLLTVFGFGILGKMWGVKKKWQVKN